MLIRYTYINLRIYKFINLLKTLIYIRTYKTTHSHIITYASLLCTYTHTDTLIHTSKRTYIFIYQHKLIYTHHHHHHHVVPLERISLILSHHYSLSFIASGRSSGLHPISSHTCCMYVRAGRPAFARPYVGVHRSTSQMSSSLLLQQCPTCLVRLTWIVFV